MPVRSSVCTYSPSSVSTNKYSTLSSLSVGQYKPLSTGVSPTSSSSSYRSSQYGRNGSTSTTSPPSSRYSLSSTTSTASSASSSAYSPLSRSSYSPSSPSTYGATSNYHSPITTTSNSSYKPLGSSLTTGNNGRYSRSTATSNYDHHHHLSSPSSSSSRYSSAGSSASLSSTASDYLSHHRDHHLTSAGSTSSAYSTASSNSSYNAYSSLSSPRRSSYTSQHTPVSPAEALPPGVPRGLINLGNTCYMNAVLQSLYSIESFRSLMLRSTASTGSSDKVLTAELSDLFRTIKDSASPISPANFKYAFSRYQSKFSGLGQQDAQEFLRYLINGVHEESNSATRRPRRKVPPPAPKSSQEAWSQYRDIVDDSPLVDLVVGQLCSTIVCGQCQNKSHCWDPFWDLSLPLSRGRYSLKLSDVVDEFTAKETLDSDERPICSHCKKATKSTKQIGLSRLPQVLILHLKKFTNDGYKLTSPDIKIDKQLTFNSSTTYNLKACISHHGHSSSSGHYTSHCEYASKWYHFNDDRVKDVTSSFDSSRLDDAYVLFYTQASSVGGGGGANIKSGYHHQSKL